MSDAPFRVGQGFDVHRFAEGRRLVLGGVEIPHARGLEGHSDADVLAHAICDALLGAAGLGDIGIQFPNSDAAYKNADSMKLLARVAELLASAGWRPVNVDATLLAEAPKIAPHVEKMRGRIGAALRLGPDRIGVKATTTERLGFTGREEGVAAMATALIERIP